VDFLHDFGCGLLMLFVAFICYDWASSWWHRRRNGPCAGPAVWHKPKGKVAPPVWRDAYTGYKVWTWFVRILVWCIAFWHLCLALLWFVELAFAISVS